MNIAEVFKRWYEVVLGKEKKEEIEFLGIQLPVIETLLPSLVLTDLQTIESIPNGQTGVGGGGGHVFYFNVHTSEPWEKLTEELLTVFGMSRMERNWESFQTIKIRTSTNNSCTIKVDNFGGGGGTANVAVHSGSGGSEI